MTPAFRFNAICKCHIAQIGNSKIERSENVLNALETTESTFRLMQWPLYDGFQTSQIGWHSKMVEKKVHM